MQPSDIILGASLAAMVGTFGYLGYAIVRFLGMLARLGKW